MKTKLGLSVLGVAVVLAVGGVAMAATVSYDGYSTTDNYYDLYVNGSLVHSDQTVDWQTADHWSGNVDLPATIAVKGSNTVDATYPPSSTANPAAFIAQVTISGMPFPLLTNDQWKVWVGTYDFSGTSNALVGDQFPPNDINGKSWTDPNYIEGSDWVAATVVASNGDAPWGTIGNISGSAKWIWDRTQSPNGYPDSPVYMRLDIATGESQPVPEPLTMIGAFLGISGLGFYVRKRTKATAV